MWRFKVFKHFEAPPVIHWTKLKTCGPDYNIKLDPAVLPLLTSFGGFGAGRASGRKKLATEHDRQSSSTVFLISSLCCVTLPPFSWIAGSLASLMGGG